MKPVVREWVEGGGAGEEGIIHVRTRIRQDAKRCYVQILSVTGRVVVAFDVCTVVNRVVAGGLELCVVGTLPVASRLCDVGFRND